MGRTNRVGNHSFGDLALLISHRRIRMCDWDLVELQLDKLMFTVNQKVLTNTNRHFIQLVGDAAERRRLLQREWLVVTNASHRPICYVRVAIPEPEEETRHLVESGLAISARRTPPPSSEGGKAAGSMAVVTPRTETPLSGSELSISLIYSVAALLRHWLSQTSNPSGWKRYLFP
eukprot:Protomagalhaensia_sp_Gyna_25__4658@NODE_437_length_3443_cov_29_478555_g304_i1_p2_GENE_NODE_437_length_3443_cov_29_478555_g304_i1NODE_437_length_3443_cov_29_478555_g304_i1_p2_ORF_typecomplete_len175_score21_03_NODE_437_length_3443_cov_29_478555_g304_i123552879